MEWMLVVAVMGGEVVETGLTYPTLKDCLAAEDQVRQETADAFNEWLQWAASDPAASGYPESEVFMRGRIGLNNRNTCVPYAAD